MGRGRPPMGKEALTNAERQQRYWEKRLHGKPKDNVEVKAGISQAEIEALRAENAKLKAELKAKAGQQESRGKRTEAPDLSANWTDWEALRARKTEEIKAKRAAAKTARAAGAAEAESSMDLAEALQKIEDLERQLKARNTRIKNLSAEASEAWRLANQKGLILTGAENRNIRACLHPDWVQDQRQKQRYEKASQAFGSLKIAIRD